MFPGDLLCSAPRLGGDQVRRCPSGNHDNDSVIPLTADDTTATTNNVDTCNIRNNAPHHRGDVRVVRARERCARARPTDLAKEEMQAYPAFLVASSTLPRRRRGCRRRRRRGRRRAHGGPYAPCSFPIIFCPFRDAPTSVGSIAPCRGRSCSSHRRGASSTR